MLHAVAAVKLQNRLETRSDLLTVFQNNPDAIRLLRPSQDDIRSLAVDSDGRLLASGDSAGVVRFENMSHWTASGRPIALRGSIPEEAMTFSADGKTLAVLSETGSQEGRTRPGARTFTRSTSRRAECGCWAPGAASSPRSRTRGLPLHTTGLGGTSRCRSRLIRRTGRSRRTHSGCSTPRRGARSGSGGTRCSPVSWRRACSSLQTERSCRRRNRVTRSFGTPGWDASSAGSRSAASPRSTRPAAASRSRSTVRVSSLRLLGSLCSTCAPATTASCRRGFRVLGCGALRSRAMARASSVRQFTARSTCGTSPAAHRRDDSSRGGRPSIRGPRSQRAHGAGRLADGSRSAFDLSGARRLGRVFQWAPPARSCVGEPCFVVNRQSDLMATDQGDGSVALIDLHTLKPVGELPARDGPIATAISFMSDGRTLLTGGSAGASRSGMSPRAERYERSRSAPLCTGEP